MGFERVTAVLQGKTSNYDTELCSRPSSTQIGGLTGRKYGGKFDDRHDIGFRVIADHLRMAASRSAMGRSRVPRNAMRVLAQSSSAGRFGSAIIFSSCVSRSSTKLVPVLVEQMGGTVPRVESEWDRVQKVLQRRGAEFFKTIQARPWSILARAAEKRKTSGGLISGQAACDLHTTYGFPRRFEPSRWRRDRPSCGRPGFEVAIEEHRRISRQGLKKLVVTAVQGEVAANRRLAQYGH